MRFTPGDERSESACAGLAEGRELLASLESLFPTLMRRRQATTLFVTVVMAAGFAAFGFPWSALNEGWHRSPEITVISPAADPRLPVLEEALDFWNHTFAGLETPFRLGTIHRVVDELPDADLQALSGVTAGWFSHGMLRGAWLPRRRTSFL